jgi:hypothetical protein
VPIPIKRCEVVEFVEGYDCMPIGEEEFDEIVWEMALAVKECSINNTQGKEKFGGWMGFNGRQ